MLVFPKSKNNFPRRTQRTLVASIPTSSRASKISVDGTLPRGLTNAVNSLLGSMFSLPGTKATGGSSSGSHSFAMWSLDPQFRQVFSCNGYQILRNSPTKLMVEGMCHKMWILAVLTPFSIHSTMRPQQKLNTRQLYDNQPITAVSGNSEGTS